MTTQIAVTNMQNVMVIATESDRADPALFLNSNIRIVQAFGYIAP